MGKARTAESYMAGLGTSGALVTGGIIACLVIGVLTFNAWPQAEGLVGGDEVGFVGSGGPAGEAATSLAATAHRIAGPGSSATGQAPGGRGDAGSPGLEGVGGQPTTGTGTGTGTGAGGDTGSPGTGTQDPGGAVGDTVGGIGKAVGDTVNGVGNTVNNAVNGVGGTLNETVNGAGNTVNQTVKGLGLGK